MDPAELKAALPQAAFAFRGYNVTNLGRSRQLLRHRRFGPIVESYLQEASAICQSLLGRKCDLVSRVRRGRETTLRSYADAIALIVAVEMAQLRILEELFDVPYSSARLSFGYSLGEISALVAGGTLQMHEALGVLLPLARDTASLARGVTLGVLFSRGPELPVEQIQKQCLLVTAEGRGVIGVSAYLSPNSMLLMGQGDTLDRFKRRLDEVAEDRIYLRKNRQQWPPMHTPIVWQKCIPDRSALLMQTIQGGLTAPQPPVLSLVTGKADYDALNVREILHRWSDHPQRLWDAVYETLACGIQTVIHVGPQPNIIPATFARLSANVEAQTQGSIGMRALSVAVSRPWLQALLPQRTALLRAPQVKQIILEDWLLEHGD